MAARAPALDGPYRPSGAAAQPKTRFAASLAAFLVTVRTWCQGRSSRVRSALAPILSSRCPGRDLGQEAGRGYAAVRHLLIEGRAERAMPKSEVQGVYGYGRSGKTGPQGMSWSTAFRLRQFARGSLWVLPLAGGLLGVLFGSGLILADKSVHLPPYLAYSSSTASTLLTTIVGAMAALTGFVVTVTVLVVQMATGSFSARYMRLWYRDRLLKALLALLVGTLAFAFALLRRTGSNCSQSRRDAGRHARRPQPARVRHLSRCVSAPIAPRGRGFGGRLHLRRLHATRRATRRCAGRVRRLLRTRRGRAGDDRPQRKPRGDPGPRCRGSLWPENTGAWSSCAIGLATSSRRARRCSRFTAIRAATSRNEARLIGSVALGHERTIEQDPAFAIRIMVDIADHALSPAVNDPTTAVQILDHLGEVLRLIGNVDDTESAWDPNRGIREGLVFPVRDWDEYLALAVTEIRSYGGNAIQVMRRMRAMLQELYEQVPPHRRPAVEEELRRLDASVAHNFAGSVDLDRAGAADPQGIGGRTEARDESG